jgi:transposase-like protein
MTEETLQTVFDPVVTSRIAHPLPNCPTCGSTTLDPVVETLVEEVHFLCRECNRCWHVGLGAVSRVSPAACLGCPEKERCTAAYARDH